MRELIFLNEKLHGFYITTCGKVISTRKGMRVLKTQYNNGGYERLRIRTSDHQDMLTIHRVVALAFIGNKEGLVVDHIDNNKNNNSVCNLQWITQSENVRKDAPLSPRRKLKQSDIKDIVKLRSEGNTYNSIGDVYGVDRKTIWRICNGQTYNKCT